VKQKVPSITCLIAGQGPLLRDLQRTSIKLGIDKSVLFLGFREDVKEILPLLDIFVLPSLWEGLPVSIMEAMAMGRPVIATDVGGCAELVLDGVTGLLVSPKDADALSKAIVSLLQDKERAGKMGLEGQERIKLFTAEEMVRKTEALYEHLLKEKTKKKEFSVSPR